MPRFQNGTLILQLVQALVGSRNAEVGGHRIALLHADARLDKLVAAPRLESTLQVRLQRVAREVEVTLGVW